jgi:hypothetical protein
MVQGVQEVQAVQEVRRFKGFEWFTWLHPTVAKLTEPPEPLVTARTSCTS